jgi:hypothetical protein
VTREKVSEELDKQRRPIGEHWLLPKWWWRESNSNDRKLSCQPSANANPVKRERYRQPSIAGEWESWSIAWISRICDNSGSRPTKGRTGHTRRRARWGATGYVLPIHSPMWQKLLATSNCITCSASGYSRHFLTFPSSKRTQVFCNLRLGCKVAFDCAFTCIGTSALCSNPHFPFQVHYWWVQMFLAKSKCTTCSASAHLRRILTFSSLRLTIGVLLHSNGMCGKFLTVHFCEVRWRHVTNSWFISIFFNKFHMKIW